MNKDIKISPINLLEEWGNFEDWENGASAAPTEFSLSGTGAAVARESSIIKNGSYSAKITYGSADAQLLYDHPLFQSYQGRKMKLGFWVYTAVANQARVKIDDGVGSSQSDYHTGGGGWEFLTVEHDMDAAATRLRVICFVDIAGVAYFDGGILCEGNLLFTDLSDAGTYYIHEFPRRKPIRQADFDPSRRHGGILGQPKHDMHRLKISGIVSGTTAAIARANYDQLLRVVMGIQDNRVDRGLRDLYFWDDRLLRGQPKNWSDNAIAAMRKIDFDFDFEMESPFEQAINRTRHTQVISSSPTAFDLTPLGSTFTKPKLIFSATAGDITSLTLENLTTGESVSYTGTVTSGDNLVIDCQEETVFNDGVDDIANHINDFLSLQPMTNKLKFTGSNCTIKLDWFNRYL